METTAFQHVVGLNNRDFALLIEEAEQLMRSKMWRTSDAKPRLTMTMNCKMNFRGIDFINSRRSTWN